MKHLAVLGTRELRSVRPEVLRSLRAAVESVVSSGGTITTLAAPGCNQWVMETALKAGGRVRCHLPVKERESSWLKALRRDYSDRLEVIAPDAELQTRCVEGVRATHPSGRYLSPAAATNLATVYGCLEDADAALMLTVLRREAHQYTRGSLESAIAMAQARQVPVCDLGNPDQRGDLRAVLANLRDE